MIPLFALGSVGRVRLAFVLLACAAALVLSSPASGAFLSVEPASGSSASTGDREPRSASRIARGATDMVSVLVRLRTEPLARLGPARATTSAPGLDTRSPQSRRRLNAVAREQLSTRLEIADAIPRAEVTARHQILLNALAVELPAADLARLDEIATVSEVYPSLTYRPHVDRSRNVIGAGTLEAATGAAGAGVKIAIVDDGIDARNPLFDPDGFTYPSGYPKGVKAHASPKIIVARSFTAPGAGPAARRPFDRSASFHGSHVAGIAAGVETLAAAGFDHPRVAQLRGVAPAAFLGNYRVFNKPSPVGNVATTSQLVAAFEAAVLDGMDVINFSGGAFEIEPARDALVEAVTNATRAGALVVVSAGNRRDMLGAGSVSSPAVAPDAIAVGAVTGDRLFAPALSLTDAGAPAELSGVPYATGVGVPLPRRLTRAPVRMLAVESLQGLRGPAVRSHLCSPRGNPNNRASELPSRSLRGTLAIVSRGVCTIASKVDRARRAGAIGVVLVDNRPGEPLAPDLTFSLPLVVISDLDGRRLVEHALASGGTVEARLGRGPASLVADRAGVIASFSSAGPTAFGHRLKPDLSAPGVSILSASNPGLTGSSFAALSGTSMAAPHVAGAAAILLERQPDWKPWQLKSALISTTTPAWTDTARVSPARPTHGGAGLLATDQAATPFLFTRPASISFGDARLRPGVSITTTKQLVLSDAGGGDGDWATSVDVAEAPLGVSVHAPPAISLAASGSTTIWLTLTVPAGTPSGAVEGHLLITRGATVRSVAFYGYVSNPKLASLHITTIRARARGSTADAASVVEAYRFPTAPFGPPASPDAMALNETGGEAVFRFDLARPAVNAGVAVIPDRPGVVVDPFILGAPDESAVLGLAAMPVTGNGALPSSGKRDGAAAVLFPKAGRYWVAVDSGIDAFTRTKLGGSYRIQRWVNDLKPPRLELLTRRLARGRGTVAVRALDAKSGIDPLTLTLTYNRLELAAAHYDYDNGVALFRIPRALPRLPRGISRIRIRASDHQEAKNVYANDTGLLTNTAQLDSRIMVDESVPHVSWILPIATRCVPAGGRVDLAVTAAGPMRIRSVRFDAGGSAIGLDRKPRFGDLFEARWNVPVETRGSVRLVAEATDAGGLKQRRVTRVRACGPSS